MTVIETSIAILTFLFMASAFSFIGFQKPPKNGSVVTYYQTGAVFVSCSSARYRPRRREPYGKIDPPSGSPWEDRIFIYYLPDASGHLPEAAGVAVSEEIEIIEAAALLGLIVLAALTVLTALTVLVFLILSEIILCAAAVA